MRFVEERPHSGSGARLVGFLHEPDDEFVCRGNRPCVVICPGGAYRRLASHECEPVAMRFYSAGFQAFILHYSVFDTENPSAKPLVLAPLKELSAAVRLIRQKALEWRVEERRVSVCGFSAGGHLAASLGVYWDHEALTGPGRSNRPDALILCYPVITAGEFAHSESIGHLAGDGERMFFSLEQHVSASVPPTFIWHTVNDASVPVENTLLFISALQKHEIVYECHLYGDGLHGLALCEEEDKRNAHCAGWFQLCLEWEDNLVTLHRD